VRVCVAHDYATQRGGAERVVLNMLKAFNSPPLYTSLFYPDGTFPEFVNVDVRTLYINRFPILRRNHRLAFPLLASSFSNLSVDADVVICSSSGWAHGLMTEGRKIVYCHAPARWLYQTDRYLGTGRPIARMAIGAVRGRLMKWDRRAADSAHRYLANSTMVQKQVKSIYGVESEIVPPPPSLDKYGDQQTIAGLEAGFFLCVSRLLPYKNVRAIATAFERLGTLRLVIVGSGPDSEVIKSVGAANVTLIGTVSDEQLRWLYANCYAVVAASYEDYGLTPLEAAVFGKPAVALRWGGFLDTVSEGISGIFFNDPDPRSIAEAVRDLADTQLPPEPIRKHAENFSEERFARRLREIADEERASL
jgi:glycosyltransferase involved in cell wall biosynthesis